MDSVSRAYEYDISIVGGAGHVGLPLGLTFAKHGLKVMLYDISQDALATIAGGRMPFIEYDAEPVLKATLNDTLFLSDEIENLAKSRHVIVAIGTPVDEYLNPKLRDLLELIDSLSAHLSPEQTLIVRSTVYPRTCAQILSRLRASKDAAWKVAYCPERIAQGYAMRELEKLPQLVAGMTPEAQDVAARLFKHVSGEIIKVSMKEAELIKLFSNAWRYVQFALANQFYMISTEFGVDFNNLRQAMTRGYGRAADLPSAGFAAGPCLFKDTMQLAAFNNGKFMLGHAAMMVNEGLPDFLVTHLHGKYDLAATRVGILGMAFKADIDDIRASLSYKLGKILRFHGTQVLYSDEYAQDPTFVSKEQLVAGSDIIIVAVPHSPYKTLAVPDDVEVLDMWNVLPRSQQAEASAQP